MKQVFLLIASSLLLFACTPSKEDLSKKMSELEVKFSQNLSEGFDIETANELLETYATFVEHYGEDKIANDIIFKAGELAMNMKKSALAIEYLESIYNRVPDYSKMEQVIFFLGNVYENQVFDIESAEKYYNDLVEKFPNGRYTNDVKQTLKTLGKTPEEILAEIENADSDTVASDSVAVDSVLEEI